MLWKITATPRWAHTDAGKAVGTAINTSLTRVARWLVRYRGKATRRVALDASLLRWDLRLQRR